MNTNKITQLGVAVAMLGMGLFTACGENHVASSFSETQTGRPVELLGRLADLDTSIVYQRIDVVDPCSAKTVFLDVDEVNVLAKASPIIDGDDNFVPACGGKETVRLYINTRVQVVDPQGKPLAGAKVYEGGFTCDDGECLYTTDKDGYIYIDSVAYLWYLQGSVQRFSSLQLRVLSADMNLGANVYSSFANASALKIDEVPFAELEKIVLEPVYSGKLSLNPPFKILKFYEYMSEKMKWGERLEKDIEERAELKVCVYSEDFMAGERSDVPNYYAPCQRVTEEDYENGYMVIYGLPEGKYYFGISEPGASEGFGVYEGFEVVKP
jgi:hypothetical protein